MDGNHGSGIVTNGNPSPTSSGKVLRLGFHRYPSNTDVAFPILKERLTTPSKKYLPLISPSNKSPKNDSPAKNKSPKRASLFVQKSSEKKHSPLRISIEHPEKKYESLSSPLNGISPSNISNRLTSIEKGIAHQLELYIERERDLEHRLRVSTEENKKLKAEVDRLWSKNQKLNDEVKEAKSKAVEYVKRAGQKNRENKNQIESSPQVNVMILSEEEMVLKAKLQELNTQIEVRERDLEVLEQSIEKDLKSHREAMEKEKREIEFLRKQLQNNTIVLEAKEKIMMEQEDGYITRLQYLEEKELELESIINERVTKAKKKMQEKLDSQLKSISTPMTSPNRITREKSIANIIPASSFPILKPTSEKSVTRLIYFSKSCMFDDNDIGEVEKHSRKKNEKHEITSFFFYDESNSSIIQIIEGPEGNVKRLFDAISEDARHFEIILLSMEVVKARYTNQPFSIYNIGATMSDVAQKALNYVNIVVRNQYQQIHRYIPPMALNRVQTAGKDSLGKPSTTEAVVLLIQINAAPARSSGDSIFTQNETYAFKTLNKIMSLGRTAISRNNGVFVSFTPDLGILSIFGDTETEKAADAAIDFLESLKKRFDQYVEEFEDCTFNPFSSSYVSIAVTKGPIWIGSLGGEDSLIYGAFGHCVSHANHIAKSLPDTFCLGFDNNIAHQLSNPFFPKYSKKVLHQSHTIPYPTPDGGSVEETSVSTLDLPILRPWT